MTPRDFCYWLQGFFEITEAKDEAQPSMSPRQVEMVRRHLAMAFVHIDAEAPPELQAPLNAAHAPKFPQTPSSNGPLIRC